MKISFMNDFNWWECLVFRGVQSARAGTEFYICVLAVSRLAAIPQARAAMNAFFPLEGRDAIRALGQGLAGAHGNAGLFHAVDTKRRIPKHHVIGKAGHGLHLAA
jgi:hypothetical protein